MFIKVRFLKNDKPYGKEYTYYTDDSNPVAVGDKIGNCVVTSVNIPEEEAAAFRDKIKNILGKVEEGED